jgi:ABC-type lipoprotein export system ATPase subunit
MNIVELERVNKVYGTGETGVMALRDVSLHVRAGEMVAIMGASGSGKSTLLHIMSGLEKPSSGRVTVAGSALETLHDKALSRLRRQSIGFVFQSYNLIPMLTARENVAVPLILDGVRRREALARAEHALGMVGLADRLGHRPAQLSGGQQQRVSIARALVINPKLILADEPTGALDSETGQEVVRHLAKLVNEQGHTVLLVTHDARVAAHAHRIVTIRDGEIIDDTALAANASRPVVTALEAVV